MGLLATRRRIGRDKLPRPPHVEVEVRFRLLDEAAALATLRQAGVKFGKPQVQDDQAYGPEWWDYRKSRINVTFARLRTSNGEELFTVKRPVTDVRTCIEHECFVSDREAMHHSILLMGFRATIRIVKTRSLAHVGNLTLCFDRVLGLGSFLEIEQLAGQDDDADGKRAEIEAFVAQLGIAVERISDTYDAMLYALEPEEAATSSPSFVAA